MSWHRSEPRPVVYFPEGREWRCACGYAEPEDARPDSDRCPDCDLRLKRVTVRS